MSSCFISSHLASLSFLFFFPSSSLFCPATLFFSLLPSLPLPHLPFSLLYPVIFSYSHVQRESIFFEIFWIKHFFPLFPTLLLLSKALETPKQITAAILAANELTEARLKALIKLNGGPNSMPKRKSSTDEKIEKSQYVTALVGVLRARNENDFGRVVKLLEAELSKKTDKKGFGNW